jgi:hypothetical protein
MSLHESWMSHDASPPFSPIERSGSGDERTGSLQRGEDEVVSSDSAFSGSGGSGDQHDIIMNVSEFLQMDSYTKRRRSADKRRRGGGGKNKNNEHLDSLLPSTADDVAILGSSYTSIDSFLFGGGGSPKPSGGGGSSRGHGSSLKKWCSRVPRIIAVGLLPLYIGSVMAMFALDRRRRALPLFINDHDWFILFSIGVGSQLSLIPLVLNLVVPKAKSTFVDLHSPSDYYAPFVLYPASSVFFCIVAVSYAILDKKAQRKNRLELSLRRRSKLQVIYAHLTNCVVYRSQWILPVVSVLSGLFCMSCRFCTESSGVECAGANQLWDPDHISEPIFFSAVGFQFCMYVCLGSFCSLAIGMYWQHQRLVRVFTFPEKFGARGPSVSACSSGRPVASSPLLPPTRAEGGGGGSKKKGGFVKEIDWHDLSNPEGISNYTVLYQQIIGSMNHHPVILSICTPAFACCIVIFVVSLAVVVVDNMYRGHGFADFTFVFMSLMTISAAVIALFIGLTVQLDKTIGLQSRIIAKVQNDVQQLIDARRKRWASSVLGGSVDLGSDALQRNDDDTIGGQTMKRLEAKVNALQALDVYVRIADSTPKLIGLSLNTIRWTTILTLLMFINFFFIVLYRIYCFDQAPAGRTRTPTLPFDSFEEAMDA